MSKPGLEPRQSIFTEVRLNNTSTCVPKINTSTCVPKINTGLPLLYFLLLISN